MICDVWEQRTWFYANTYPESIQTDEAISDEVKSQCTVDENHWFYNSEMKYCDLFRPNLLYISDLSK